MAGTTAQTGQDDSADRPAMRSQLSDHRYLLEEVRIEMNYAIISINEERSQYKKNIYQYVDLPKIDIDSFNSYKQDPLEELNRRGLKINLDYWTPKTGELGIWLSNINAWQSCVNSEEPLIVFEDDAVVTANFMSRLKRIVDVLPADYGLLSLWVPENQYNDYSQNIEYDDFGFAVRRRMRMKSGFETGVPMLAKAYQGYGGVATLYSPAGARALLDATRELGLMNPSDCFIYMMVHSGRVQGYAPIPGYEIVSYDWSAKTTVQDTERAF